MIGSTIDRVAPENLFRSPWQAYLLAAAFFIAMPFVFGVLVASQIIVFAIFAMGYNVILGYGGEMSFGHAAYFGMGAYGVILTTVYLDNLYLGILVGIAAAALVGLVFGWLSLRRRGIYFGMITLALAQMLYFPFFNNTELTGGANGIGIPFEVEAIGPLNPGAGGFEFYVFAVVVLLAVWFGIRRLIRSPYGRILVAIRENETRAKSLGYDTDRVLLLAFVVSCAISGVAGVMYALLFSFVTPSVLFWTVSGEVVLITVIGGIGTLNGPIIGAVIFQFLSENLTRFFDVWEFVFGLIIVLFVIFAPQGVYGLYLRRRDDQGHDGWRLDRLFRRWYRDLFD